MKEELVVMDGTGEVPAGFPAVPSVTELDRLLVGLILQVPRGRVTTPKVLAGAIGDHGAARFVGERLAVLRREREERLAGSRGEREERFVELRMERGVGREEFSDAPLHRVVLSSGEVRWGEDALTEEGVVVRGGEVQGLKDVLVSDLRSEGGAPLAVLKEYQVDSAMKVHIEELEGYVSTVGGVDVSYDLRTGGAVACCTVMDNDGSKVMERSAVRTRVSFPYISGYLGFREVPPMVEAVGALRTLPDIMLVDGHGILHPRRFGVACQLGVTLDIPAVGCAKRMLVGKLAGPTTGKGRGQDRMWERPSANVPLGVELDGEGLGWSLPPSRGTRHAVVSPAHRCGLEGARAVTAPLLFHQMPEPIRLSHTASKRVVASGRP